MALVSARLLVVLLLSTSLSGCLAHDIWREPFEWEPALTLGENVDAAQALAAGFSSLGDRGAGEGGAVVDDAASLPDGAPFQNAKAFLDRQSPGAGQQTEDSVRIVTNNASGAYVELTGDAAAAYRNATGPIAGTSGPVPMIVPDRTTRLRWTLDVVLEQESPEPGGNPTPAGAIQVQIQDPRGAKRAVYDVDTTRQIQDMVFEGTWGDENEVRSHLGGIWMVSVDAQAQGSWSLTFDAYVPEYEDYHWWQFWRGERRQVDA